MNSRTTVPPGSVHRDPPSGPEKKKVLMMPEGSILAHVGRTRAVADVLEDMHAGVEFAASGKHTDRLNGPVHDIYSVPRQTIMRRLEGGGSLFRSEDIHRCVRDEIRVLRSVRPDVVVGDFRPSLSISARHTGIPYVCLVNTMWTTKAAFELDPPESWPITRLLGKSVVRTLQPLVQPVAFLCYAEAFNRVRRLHGLHPLRDLRDCMADADLTLLLDLPELFPVRQLPSHYECAGPIIWQPDLPVPDWINDIDDEKPTVYLTMGSTGNGRAPDALARQLIEADYQVMWTTGGYDPGPDVSAPDLYLTDYAPGQALCERADVVVCHGGNGTIYQALSRGTPVVGLPGFHDQEFNMQRVEAVGVGRKVSRAICVEALCSTVKSVLEDNCYQTNAGQIRKTMGRWNGPHKAARCIIEASTG